MTSRTTSSRRAPTVSLLKWAQRRTFRCCRSRTFIRPDHHSENDRRERAQLQPEAGRRGQELLSRGPSSGGHADLLDHLARYVLRQPVLRERRLWVKDGPILSQARSRSKGPLSDQVADTPDACGQCRSWVASRDSMAIPRTAGVGAKAPLSLQQSEVSSPASRSSLAFCVARAHEPLASTCPMFLSDCIGGARAVGLDENVW
jgi:hypothetical protein